MNATLMKVGKSALKWTSKHSPELLAGVGVAALIGTAIFAAKAGPELKRISNTGRELMDEAKNDPESDPERLRQELRDIRKSMCIRYAKTLWKPATTVVIGSIAIIGSNRLKHKALVGMTGAYLTTVQEMKDLKDSIKELKLLNKNQEQKVRDKMAEKKVERAVKNKQPVVISSGGGDDLFIDDWSGQIFKSTSTNVEQACIELNHQMLREDSVTMNDFYYRLGIPEVPSGDLGFESVDGPVEVEFGSVLKDGKAYITVGFSRSPILV